ncbi:hypothetical protein EDC19_1075 [Natranaerovirga hydrolytica]|uniref:Uncharacterized protein n=1 Tax=Natranaerovirga hydrolytica TaxID=680378 RepID=A0A4R1N7K0_9FIRM|nr:hypothetical protein [Natranaerovirga hydrolytica]TCK98643.1 hypothetical protein EDC19_1075 [Natranaerovirga hydrolytica]
MSIFVNTIIEYHMNDLDDTMVIREINMTYNSDARIRKKRIIV